MRVFREFFLSKKNELWFLLLSKMFRVFVLLKLRKTLNISFFSFKNHLSRESSPRTKQKTRAARTTKNTRARPEKKKKKKKKNALSLSFFCVSQNFLSFSLNEETRVIHRLIGRKRKRERQLYFCTRWRRRRRLITTTTAHTNSSKPDTRIRFTIVSTIITDGCVSFFVFVRVSFSSLFVLFFPVESD